MYAATTIGIDLAKNSFHVYGMNKRGAKVFSRALPRGKLIMVPKNRTAC